MARRRRAWDAEGVRRLRSHLELTQREFAEELGVRQQTVSEWETGAYRPRGASERLLSIIADRAGYAYGYDVRGDDAGREAAAEEDAGAREDG
ncbi:MAG TPA: helix-turn-helix domain-containing protein [Dehalococcoidia bacterium]|nr:helix-turn-helix domain-containing protein [Dehalococcoidia bacterium]